MQQEFDYWFASIFKTQALSRAYLTSGTTSDLNAYNKLLENKREIAQRIITNCRAKTDYLNNIKQLASKAREIIKGLTGLVKAACSGYREQAVQLNTSLPKWQGIAELQKNGIPRIVYKNVNYKSSWAVHLIEKKRLYLSLL